MGRPENPLAGPPYRRKLALHLRTAANVTYEQMASAADASAATFKRTASGVITPKWSRVSEFCLAIHRAENPESRVPKGYFELRDKWVVARMEQRGTLYLKQPRPEYIVDKADLSHALYALYEHTGAPPLRDVQERAGGPEHLPLSTLARIVRRQTLPADTNQFIAFLRGCSVHERPLYEKWLKAWSKVVSEAEITTMDLTFSEEQKAVIEYMAEAAKSF
ncbi:MULTISPECIES: hypothetical protein [unclassified Streptomyces]|uniref:hypothetical protein n=1 Tax=unclassified Streptomyces TaxID=2593676 RepID=UPI0029B7F6D9|nr:MULTISPECIES: hypothetical protein [unclassified Streptomyces]MDX3772357.1 hypothetical protein [Streptomyces sp. AK08-01B]MDX3821859.1 hypothetical protein [Streptomyces sp. AK08-01A]